MLAYALFSLATSLLWLFHFQYPTTGLWLAVILIYYSQWFSFFSLSIYLFLLELLLQESSVSYKVIGTKDRILYGYSFRNITGMLTMDQCLAKCLKDCKCLSFQICEDDKLCQLCSTTQQQNEGSFLPRKGCSSFVFKKEQQVSFQLFNRYPWPHTLSHTRNVAHDIIRPINVDIKEIPNDFLCRILLSMYEECCETFKKREVHESRNSARENHLVIVL